MKRAMKLSLKTSATLAVCSAAMLISGASSSAQNSPVGTVWDCLINGTQGAGVAYIQFYDGGVLDGVSIIRPRRPVTTSSNDSDGPRGGEDVDRTGTSSPSPSTGTNVSTGIYGFGSISGQWAYDAYNRVIGNFFQVIETGGTNAFKTNMIGFRAIVVPARRLTLTAYTPNNGRSTFLGLPMSVTLSDLTGSWYGVQRGTGEVLVEFFDTAPASWMNAYSFLGAGAAYDTDGYVILTKRGRIGIASIANGKLRATVGTYTRRTGFATTSGMLEPGTWIRYTAHKIN